MIKSLLYNLYAMQKVMADYRLSRKELQPIIKKRLHKVLITAFRFVPYYRDAFRAVGYNPEVDYHGPEDLKLLPILTKETIKKYGEEAFVREGADLSKYFMDATSGSTGIPLRVWRDPWARALQIAKWLRVMRVNGYRLTDRVMSLTSPARLNEGKTILRHLGLLRRHAVDYLLPPEVMLEELLAYKPDVLYGNRSHLDLLCHEAQKRNIRYEDLKLILTGAEIVRESSRRLYRNTFNCDIVEYYGSIEMGIMAFETPTQKALELCEDLTFYEVLDDHGAPTKPGELGRLIVTDLSNTLMPFIRYDHLDKVVLSPERTADRRERQLIEYIEGRDDDFAIMPDGKTIPFHVFYEIMDKYTGIIQFRIVQKTIKYYQILILANKDYIQSVKSDISADYSKIFPEDVKFEIIPVDRIEPDPNGKLRMLISEV